MCKCSNAFSKLVLIGREAWPYLFLFNAFEIDSLYFSFLSFPVTMARMLHPFPFRTRKLSSSAPMVLRGGLRGRVGRCRNYLKKPPGLSRGLFICARLHQLRSWLLHVSAPSERWAPSAGLETRSKDGNLIHDLLPIRLIQATFPR